jgi:carbon-monoxide dehydrogenase medium subunit
VDDARVALIGVGETAVRSTQAEEVLRGERPTTALFAEAAKAAAAALEPNGDIHASAQYRRDVSDVLVRRALDTALERALGGADGRP